MPRFFPLATLLFLGLAGCHSVSGLTDFTERDEESELEPQCLIPFEDDFQDGSLPPRWEVRVPSPGVAFVEADGLLYAQVATNQGAFSVLGSTASFDLRDCAVLAKVAPEPGSPLTSLFGVLDASGTAQLVGMAGGEIVAFVQPPQEVLQTRSSAPYDPVAHAWWRLRDQDGVVIWETSADTETWQTLHQETSPDDLDEVNVVVGIGSVGPAMGTTLLDAVNQPWNEQTISLEPE